MSYGYSWFFQSSQKRLGGPVAPAVVVLAVVAVVALASTARLLHVGALSQEGGVSSTLVSAVAAAVAVVLPKRFTRRRTTTSRRNAKDDLVEVVILIIILLVCVGFYKGSEVSKESCASKTTTFSRLYYVYVVVIGTNSNNLQLMTGYGEMSQRKSRLRTC